MMRLIDADALREELKPHLEKSEYWILAYINKIPTVVPAAGEWHEMSDGLPEKDEEALYLCETEKGFLWIVNWIGDCWDVLGWQCEGWDDYELKRNFKRWAEIRGAK